METLLIGKEIHDYIESEGLEVSDRTKGGIATVSEMTYEAIRVC